MPDRTCLITGANRGIGKATARHLARAGFHVTLLCRNEAAARRVVDEINRETGRDAADPLIGDLASLASIRQAAERFAATHPRLDVLINNAAVVSNRRRTTPDGLELQFAVNHLGPFLLTNLLRPLLIASAPARVINVSSGAHYRGRIDLDDLQFEREYAAYPAYRSTKLANVLFTRELARRLAGTGVTVNAVHPGVIATGLLGNLARVPKFLVPLLRVLAGPPSAGAHNVAFLATDPDLEDVSGAYFSDRQREEPSPQARDDALAARLWEISARLTGIDEAA